MLRLLAILLCALWLSGCFIADELRKGDALIEQHSVGWRKKKERIQQAEAEAAKVEAEREAQLQQARNTGPGVQDKLNEWWHETVDEDPVKVNSSDAIVSCTIGGKVQFIRESDCAVRRGRAKQLKAEQDAGANGSANSSSGT
jgi:hypothetical protein